METIKIEVNTDGTTQVTVNGVKGKRCAEVTANLEAELGKVTSTKKTTEFYEKEQTVGVRASNRGR